MPLSVESTCEELAQVIRSVSDSAEAHEAFELLRKRHAHKIVAFAASRLVRRADAEDVAQDVWLVVWEKISAQYERGNVLAWIFQITANRCIDHNKKKRPDLFPEGALPNSGSFEDSDPTVLAIVQREKMNRLQECIEKLDQRLRCVVTATLRGHKTAAVAQHCSLTPNQVSKSKALAVVSLQECTGGVEV